MTSWGNYVKKTEWAVALSVMDTRYRFYMNLIEGWGTGIPRLFREMKEYGLPEPEFVDMEIALRINLYRVADTVQRSAELVPESAEPLSEQQALIYQMIA